MDIWDQWREENYGVKPDLDAANLQTTHLCGVDLSGANLSRINLYKANLWKDYDAYQQSFEHLLRVLKAEG